MNVFISSVIRNFESYRAAAKKAVTLLGHVPVMCEDFGARPYSSQEACMTEVEQADAVATSSFTMSHRSEQEVEERRLLIPATPAAYGRWLADVMFKFKRKLAA